MEKLNSFLDQFRVKRKQGSCGDPFTHVTKSTPSFFAGSYYIQTDYIEQFLTLYANAVRNKYVPSIAERPAAYGPLRVDFDFSANIDVGVERQYDTDMLKKIVGYYQDEIRKCAAEFRDEMLWCIVLEKQAPRVEEGKIKDGFHLHFPHFFCEGRLQDEYLRGKVTTKMVTDKIWSKAKISTDVDKIIDYGMATKPWMMYGSMNYKGPHSTAYLYNRRQPAGFKDPWKNVPDDEQYGHVFDHNLREIPMETVFADEMAGRKSSVRYYLPRFMSIRGFVESTKLVEEVERKLINTRPVKRRKTRVIQKRNIEEVLKDIKTIKDGNIMEMLAAHRADIRDEWLDVGWILFNIGQGHEEALAMWIEFSQRSEKFKPGECEDLWNTMEIRNKTIGSLLMMAKTDNPTMYKEWKNTNVRHFLIQSLTESKPTEFDVAMVVAAMYKDCFLCADAKKDIWYEFRDHRYHKMDDNIALKNLLVSDVIHKYRQFKVEIVQQQAGQLDETERAKLELQEKRICAIISKLKTVKFHEQVIKMCKLKMHDINFHKRMNENKNIVVCENGVLDLEFGIFRDGRPDDYSTFSTGIHYQEYNPRDDDVIDVEEFLEKVFPNVNRRNYFVDMASACLQGGNVNKRLLIATGCGDNSKSVTYTLLEMVFGDYFGKFPRELLICGKGSSSNAPRPDLDHVRGKRIMSTQEITHMDNFNIGVLKELTGNDSFFARNLFERGTEIKPMFTLWLQCNEPPKIPGHDEATWSRIRILDFESKFVKPEDRKRCVVPETHEEQMKMKRFAADPNFMRNLVYLAPALLWKLFRHFPKYKEHGLRESKEVMQSTVEYKTDNDIYLEFIKERVECVKDKELAKTAYISLNDMYIEFKDWYRENHPSYAKNMIGKSTMKNELTRRLGSIHDPAKDLYGFGTMSRWWGYRMIQEEDCVDEVQKLLQDR